MTLVRSADYEDAWLGLLNDIHPMCRRLGMGPIVVILVTANIAGFANPRRMATAHAIIHLLGNPDNRENRASIENSSEHLPRILVRRDWSSGFCAMHRDGIHFE